MFKVVIGHRGERLHCPENTIPAFLRAFELGADAIECDLRLSKDRKGVIIHDKDLNRTCGQNFLVHDLELSELKRLDFGHWKDVKWAGTQIPTLEETLSLIPEDKVIHLEIKAEADALDVLEEALNSTGFDLKQIVLTGFGLNIAQLAKKRFPSVLFLVNGLKFNFSQVIDSGADGIATFFNADLVQEAQEAGLLVRVGAVNTLQEALRVSSSGVEIIDSDDLEQLFSSINK